jgi:hypothetical protein
MKRFIRKLLREDIEAICNLEYESDRIRFKEIKSALNDEIWGDYEFYSIDDLYETEWLSKAINKKNYIDYYELFVNSCWKAMFQKPEYKGLDKKTAIAELVKNRFTKIGKILGLELIDWSYHSSVLNIKFKKSLNEEIVGGYGKNKATDLLCNKMTIDTYKEGLNLIINSIGHPNENPKIWERISKPLKNWQEADLKIGKEVRTSGMSGGSMMDESNTWWATIQSTICNQEDIGLR